MTRHVTGIRPFSTADLDAMSERLRATLVSDILDGLGRRSQCPTPGLAPIVPGTSLIGYAFDPVASKDFYDSTDDFVSDAIAVQRQIIDGLVEAGCEYVHLDEPGFTAYVDEASIAALREHGAADNAVLDAFPDTTSAYMSAATTGRVTAPRGLLRRHRRGTLRHPALSAAPAGVRHRTRRQLRAAAPRPQGHDRRPGADLHQVRPARDLDELTRRIEEATKYLPVEQLALSPQCRFVSVIAGNRLTEDDQWRKLEVMLQAL